MQELQYNDQEKQSTWRRGRPNAVGRLADVGGEETVLNFC